jgi:hypothetical protein
LDFQGEIKQIIPPSTELDPSLFKCAIVKKLALLFSFYPELVPRGSPSIPDKAL